MHQALEEAQKKLLEKYKSFPFVNEKLFRTKGLGLDIPSWAQFPPLVDLVDTANDDPAQFKKAIDGYATPATTEFVKKLGEESEANPLVAIGCMYVLYGTLGKGGKRVKENVDSQFGTRSKNDLHEGTHLFNIEGVIDLEAFFSDWGRKLNEIPSILNLNEDQTKELERLVIKYANFTFSTIFQFIDELDIEKKC